MNERSAKPRVALYAYKYLAPSMTFIHRQLTGVAPHVDTMVVASEGANIDRFPTDRLEIVPRTSLGKFFAKAMVKYAQYCVPLEPHQRQRIAALLREQRAQLIHAHFGPSGIEILPVAKQLGLPLLVTFHGFDASQLLRSKAYVRQLIPLLDYAHVIAVSSVIARRMIALGAAQDRVHVHHIGVPLDRFLFSRRVALRQRVAAGETIRLLQVASLVEKKGHAYTLQAFAQFRQRCPNSRLMLIGDGPLRSSLQKLSTDLGLQEHVDFLGSRSPAEVAEAMSNADVFVHHSVTAANGDEEGIPTSIMEAMACGLPIVSTRHAGIPEIVVEGTNGYLVDERDVAAYSQRLWQLLELEVDHGAESRAIAEAKLDMAIQNRALASLYIQTAAESMRLAPRSAENGTV